MSTIKVNEVSHLSNSGDANITLANTGATTLKDATVVNLTTTSVTVSGTTTINGNSTVGNASSDTCTLTATTKGQYMYAGFTGEIRMWSTGSAPTTWLICDGETIGNNTSGADNTPSTTSLSTLQPLFDHLKSGFGNSGSESYTNGDTVDLPDFKGRIGIGVGQQTNVKWRSESSNYTNSGTSFTLGATGGTEDHSLLLTESPAHTHAGTVDSQTTGVTVATTLSLSATTTVGTHNHTLTDPTHSHAHTHNFSHTHDAEYTGHGLSSGTDGSHTHTISPNPHTHSYTSPTVGGGEYLDEDAWGPVVEVPTQNGATSTGTTLTNSTTGSHSHTISGKVGTPIDFAGNASITTDAATSHAQATGITIAATSSGNPSVSVTLRNSDDSGAPSATSTPTDSGHQHPYTTSSRGSDGAHNNLQPYIGIHYIIKA